MKDGVYYWQANDKIVYIRNNRIIDILFESKFGIGWFTVQHPRSRVLKLKTLIYLGEL